MNLSVSLLVGLLLVFVGGPGQEASKHVAQDVADSKTRAKSVTPNPPIASNDTEYKIGEQDVLRVDVWKEPDFSRQVPVRPDGKITLPLLNDVQAAGLTPMQLSVAISDGLKRFITAPQVTVTVADINSRRVYVTGEVSHAGSFALLPNMTVLQALTSAGGFTQFAKLKNIYILRTVNGKQVTFPFNYKEVVKGHNQEQNILLESGDLIVVP